MVTRTVAIYARVSTEHEAQLSALDNQIKYYEDLMAKHPEWILYDRYIDEGITGTSTTKRKNFIRMMKDAEDGKFDLIVTREVSRFARNTVDTLQETRKLKKIGVEVWFTEDNIWTLNDEDGELRLTIMATLAQNESKKTSIRVKAGQMVSFRNGVPYGNGNILGYDKLPNHGGYVINPEQAETVKMIFDMYEAGNGVRNIQFALEKAGRKTAMGLTKWAPATVGRILKNSFYCGVVEYRKQYVPDYLEQKKINNHGAVDRVVVEGNHEPIVTRQQYDNVMRIMASKTMPTVNSTHQLKTGAKNSEDVYARKLVCECGSKMNRQKWYVMQDGTVKYAYQCQSTNKTGSYTTRLRKGLSVDGVCQIPMIQRWKMEIQAKLIFQMIFKSRGRVIKMANELLDDCIIDSLDDDGRSDEVKQLNAQLAKYVKMRDALLEMRLLDEIPRDEYATKKKELDEEIKILQDRINSYSNKNVESIDINDRIKVLQYAVEQKLKFDSDKIPDAMIDALVEKIVVHKDYFEWHLRFFDEDVINCLVEGAKPHKAQALLMDDSQLDERQHRPLSLISNAIL